MEELASRIRGRLEESGGHHVWTGARRGDGIGVVKVDGRTVTVGRAVWELAHGPLPPGARVLACPEERACARLEHLRLDRDRPARSRRRGAKAPNGSGSKRQVRPGVWKLEATTGRLDDGGLRRSYRTERAGTETEAARLLAAFVAEVQASPPPGGGLRDVTVDGAVELHLAHLRDDKGRADKTVRDYRLVHRRWFAAAVGARRVRDVDAAALDAVFGSMQRSGLSRSRLREARALYSGLFRWAQRRGIVGRSPMAGFDTPTSTYVSRQRPPAEAEEMALLLAAAAGEAPEVVALLTLGAVTGMRRGELVAVRRKNVLWDELRITVDSAADGRGRLKPTKTRRQRTFEVDGQTMAMLGRHCAEMDERAAVFGATVAGDAFVFSLEPDCSRPMPADYVTGRVGVVKEHLGIADKRPETAALEDEALRLHRGAPEPRPPGRTGPAPTGGLSYREIGERLGRSASWAATAVAAAERREAASARGLRLRFDGSVQGLRRFTSTELLDAGFNVSAVASRQGHSPRVLVDHYSRRRRSADRDAAEHLAVVVHGRVSVDDPRDCSI